MKKLALPVLLLALLLSAPGRPVAHGQTVPAPSVQIVMTPGVATVGQPVQFRVTVYYARLFTVAWAREKHGRPEATSAYHVEQNNPAPTAIVITPREPGTWYLLVNAPGIEQFSMIVPVLPEGR